MSLPLETARPQQPQTRRELPTTTVWHQCRGICNSICVSLTPIIQASLRFFWDWKKKKITTNWRLNRGFRDWFSRSVVGTTWLVTCVLWDLSAWLMKRKSKPLINFCLCKLLKITVSDNSICFSCLFLFQRLRRIVYFSVIISLLIRVLYFI